VLINGEIGKHLDPLVRAANAHPSSFVIRKPIYALPLEPNGPGLMNHLPTNTVEESRLPSSIRSDQSDTLTRTNFDVHMVHGNDSTERLGQIRNAQQHVGGYQVSVIENDLIIHDQLLEALERIR
jgi:hypothetical protein